MSNKIPKIFKDNDAEFQFEFTAKLIEKTLAPVLKDSMFVHKNNWLVSGGFISKMYTILTELNRVGSVTGMEKFCKAIRENGSKLSSSDMDLFHVGTHAQYLDTINYLQNTHKINFDAHNPEDYGASGHSPTLIYNTSIKENRINPVDTVQLIGLFEHTNIFDVTKKFDFVHVKPFYDLTTKSFYITERQFRSIVNKTIDFNKPITNVGVTRLRKWINNGYFVSDEDAKIFNNFWRGENTITNTGKHSTILIRAEDIPF